MCKALPYTTCLALLPPSLLTIGDHISTLLCVCTPPPRSSVLGCMFGLDVVVTCSLSYVVKPVLLSATLSFPFYLALDDTKSYTASTTSKDVSKIPPFQAYDFSLQLSFCVELTQYASICSFLLPANVKHSPPEPHFSCHDSVFFCFAQCPAFSSINKRAPKKYY